MNEDKNKTNASQEPVVDGAGLIDSAPRDDGVTTPGFDPLPALPLDRRSFIKCAAVLGLTAACPVRCSSRQHVLWESNPAIQSAKVFAALRNGCKESVTKIQYHPHQLIQYSGLTLGGTV